MIHPQSFRSRLGSAGSARSFGLIRRRCLAVNRDTRDHQPRYDIVALVVAKNEDASTAWRNSNAIDCRNPQLPAICQVNCERNERGRMSQFSNVGGHNRGTLLRGPKPCKRGIFAGAWTALVLPGAAAIQRRFHRVRRDKHPAVRQGIGPWLLLTPIIRLRVD